MEKQASSQAGGPVSCPKCKGEVAAIPDVKRFISDYFQRKFYCVNPRCAWTGWMDVLEFRDGRRENEDAN